MPLRRHFPRLPTRHIYRAFPELDTYSDEQCQRFMRASRGGHVRTIIHILIILAITIAGFVGGSLFLFWFINSTTQNVPIMNLGKPAPLWQSILYVVLIIATVAFGPICGFLARDFLVIDRIRWILRSRGLCPTCRYSLVGLAVDAEARVLCPECGNTTAVDPSLGELTTDESGRPRFKPDIPHHIKAPILLRLPLGLKRWFKRAAWLGVALIGLVILVVIGYEVLLHIQASAARRNRPTHQAWLDLIESAQPAGTVPSEPDGFEIALRIGQCMKDAETAARLDHRVADPDGIYNNADYQLICLSQTLHSQWYPPDTDLDAIRAFTLDAINRMETEGIAPLIDELIASRRAFDTPPQASSRSPLSGEWLNSTANLINIGSMLSARAHVALERGDADSFAQSLEGLLACSRIAAMSPRTYSLYWSTHFQSQANSRVFDAIRRGLPPGWIPRILDGYARQSIRPPIEYQLKGEGMLLDDAVSWLFEDVGDIRLGPWSPKILKLKEDFAQWGAIALPVGTYRVNAHEAAARVDHFRALFTAPDARSISSVGASPAPAHLVIALYDPFVDQVVLTRHVTSLTTSAAILALHIEQFRADHSAPPVSLDALVPGYLPALPIDPWDGRPLKFLVLDPTADPFGRPFILYSVGADESDDSGRTFNPVNQRRRLLLAPIPADLVGYDYVFNDPEQFP